MSVPAVVAASRFFPGTYAGRASAYSERSLLPPVDRTQQAILLDIACSVRELVTLLRSENSIGKIGAARPFVTAKELATLLGTSVKNVYSMAERGQLPGIVRSTGKRKLRFRTSELLPWFEGRAPSSKGNRR